MIMLDENDENRHHLHRFSSGKNTKNLESNGLTRCIADVETLCNVDVETRRNNNVETWCTASLHKILT